MPTCDSGMLADFDPILGMGHGCTNVKLRRDRVNWQKTTERTGDKVALDVDSNKLHYDSVSDGSYSEVIGKRQRDIDNENRKMWIGTQVMDLAQCQDSSLRLIESSLLSSSPVMPSTKYPETSVKSALCGGSETSVKMNFDFAAETLSDLPSKNIYSMHVVDLCQVEPALEKGCLEDKLSEKKTEDGTVIDVEDVSTLLPESILKKLADGDVEVLSQESPYSVQDATHHHFFHQKHRRTKGKKTSRAVLLREFVTENATSSDGKELPGSRTRQKKKKKNIVTERHRDKELFRNFLLKKKLCLWMERAKHKEWMRLLWSKHPSSHHKSGFLMPVLSTLAYHIAKYNRT